MLINISRLSTALIPGLRELAPMLSMELSESEGCELISEPADGGTLAVRIGGNVCRVSHGTKAAFYKAVTICAAHFSEEGYLFESDVKFGDLCAMLDCSRNAVPTVCGAKDFIMWLALHGFNSAMLYTEDTFGVEGYPYFGYMRGRFSSEEIKEIREYGDLFGIELIPCIQTLAHLNQALRWPVFDNVRDIHDILLAGEEKTYELIEAMLASCRKMFTTENIHIGMDEAHMVGLGAYLKKHGLKDRFGIMNNHLRKVSRLCEKYGFKPMMWSDMYFRLAFGDYYTGADDLDQGILADIPESIAMVYWDYYGHGTEKYNSMFKKHRKFGRETVFAGGAWCWTGFTPNNKFSIKATRAALESAARFGVKRVIATLWGDDGHECPPVSVFPTLAVYSQINYGFAGDEAELHRQFKAAAGMDFADFMAIDSLENFDCIPEDAPGMNPAKYLLYQDCLAGLFDLHLERGKTREHFGRCHTRLAEIAEAAPARFAPLFSAHAALAAVLELKSELGVDIREAYKGKDMERLRNISDEAIPELIARIEAFYGLYRELWLSGRKPAGLEIMDIRFGGLVMRLKTVTGLLKGHIDGKISQIPELEEEVLPYGSPANFSQKNPYTWCSRWHDIVSPNVVSHCIGAI